MEPVPLIPRIENIATPEMVCLVREVFQSAFQSETAAWKISINLSKSCRQYPDLKLIAAQIQAEIIEHKATLDDVKYAEIKIMESRGYYLCRDHRIKSKQRAMEIIRLKRHPLYIDLHPDIVEHYPLLQSDDLLPPVHERDTDFRLDKQCRIKMKKRLYKSRDSLLDEILLPKVKSRTCRFDTITEQKSRKMKTKKRLSMIQMTIHKRSIIRSECLKTVFIAEPEELIFHNFEYHKMYKKIVLLKNISNSIARYKIERRSPDSKFTIFFDSKSFETTKIAPGMHIKLVVSFLCDVIEDPEESLIINVQNGKTVCVKLRGYRDFPILKALSPLYQISAQSVEVESSTFLSVLAEGEENEIHVEQLTETLGNIQEYSTDEFNDQLNVNLGATFECGKCFRGERILVLTRFINDGGDGKFFIMSEMDWCTMNIDDITDCNVIVVPPFAMWPVYFTLRSDECIEIRIYFYPTSYGTQVDKLYILCDNHTIHPIELIGDGILYDPSFLHFGDNVEKIGSSITNNEPFANYHLNMGIISSDETIQNPVHVTNTSGLEIDYRWEKHPVKYSTSNLVKSCASLPLENLDIQPAKGSLNASSITIFTVIADTRDLEDNEYCATLRLYVEDIPLAAIPKDSHLTIKECCVKRRNCPITVDVLVADIEVWVHCLHGKLTLYSHISEETKENIRCSNEAEILNGLSDNFPSSSSVTGVQSHLQESGTAVDDSSKCGMENGQWNKYYTGMENSENPWSVSFSMTEILENDISALAGPGLELQHPTANTAILIPNRPLYVGVQQVCTISLRNLICKPLFYVWGQPLEQDSCKMKVNFNPEKGFVPPTNAARIEVTCLPIDTGTLDNFFIPCFIEGRQNPIMLGIECTIDTLYVTFIFLPVMNILRPPYPDSVRVEWTKDGHTSALNLNNLKMNRNSKIEEEQELKNIDLDAGQVVATTAVGPSSEEAGNISLLHFPETPSRTKQELNEIGHNKMQNKSIERSKLNDNAIAAFEWEKVDSHELRSWESLLEGIVWTDNRPDEFITLTKPQTIVPFYKTIVPPIMQAVSIEFVALPLRTVEKRTFIIRNETSAESTFSILLKQFGPMEVVETSNLENTIDMIYANVMGNKSENDWEAIKPPGQGIVLMIEPKKGNLAPHETVPIYVYAYADTWGVYVDEITIAIIGLPDYIFGVCAQVVGSPIAYPICKTALYKIPILKFGTPDFYTESVTRKIIVENTSSIILTVNWYSYLIDPSPVTKNSIPFNIILLMVSPFTNKIANMTCTNSTNDYNAQKISTADSIMERSEQNILDSNKCDLVGDSTIIEMNSTFPNCYQVETQSQSFRTSTSDSIWETYFSQSVRASDRIPSQGGQFESGNSISTNHEDNEYAEYTTDSDIKSVSLSEQTIDKETDLKLSLTPHYGEPDYSVFTVSPAEIIIPAKEKRCIEITLNVAKNNLQRENCNIEIRGRLMGFLRVAPMHKYKADCYSRNDGVMLTPTEIQFEATIIQPTLAHKITQNDRTFEIFASNVLTHFGKQVEIRRKYVFHNKAARAMFINGQSTEPFQVLRLSTLKTSINALECDGISVLPGHRVEVDVLCSINASWISKATEISKYQNAEGSYVDIKKNLLIYHIGSCNQILPLYLRVYLPLLKLSIHKIEFGIIHIEDSKQIDLMIENVSRENQVLNIRARENNKDFVIFPSQSILSHAGRTLGIAVTFTASKTDKSVEVLEISTAIANYVEECIIEGYGGLDTDE